MAKKAQLVLYENDTHELEENIYELSVGNCGRMGTREKLVEVLPEIFYKVRDEKKQLTARSNNSSQTVYGL